MKLKKEETDQDEDELIESAKRTHKKKGKQKIKQMPLIPYKKTRKHTKFQDEQFNPI